MTTESLCNSSGNPRITSQVPSNMLDHDRFCNRRLFRCICVCEPFHLPSSVICSLVLFCPDYFLMTVEGKSYGRGALWGEFRLFGCASRLCLCAAFGSC